MLKASITFNNKTDDALSGIGRQASIAVQKSLIVMEGNIKKATPIRTGTLARSITRRNTSALSGEIYTAPIDDGKEINYAIFVEYGTRYMAPRAMFRKGVAASEPRIQQIFDEELGKKVV